MGQRKQCFHFPGLEVRMEKASYRGDPLAPCIFIQVLKPISDTYRSPIFLIDHEIYRIDLLLTYCLMPTNPWRKMVLTVRYATEADAYALGQINIACFNHQELWGNAFPDIHDETLLPFKVACFYMFFTEPSWPGCARCRGCWNRRPRSANHWLLVLDYPRGAKPATTEFDCSRVYEVQ